MPFPKNRDLTFGHSPEVENGVAVVFLEAYMSHPKLAHLVPQLAAEMLK